MEIIAERPPRNREVRILPPECEPKRNFGFEEVMDLGSVTPGVSELLSFHFIQYKNRGLNLPGGAPRRRGSGAICSAAAATPLHLECGWSDVRINVESAASSLD